MGINITPLFWAITEKLKENLTPYEIQLYSKAIDLLKFGKLFTVPTFADLPSVSNSTNGQLIFVEAENVLYTYKAVTGQWESVSTPIQSNMLLWGDNASSRLGIDSGNVFIYTSPVTVDVFNDWCDVSANFCHTAAVRTNGTLWTWGSNSAGRLGDGTIISRISPISVIGGFTDWCQASVGFLHTTAVRSNGTLWSWGCGLCGILGTGYTSDASSPVSVVGGFTDWCQVSTNNNNVAAIRTNGTLWGWGCNAQGRVGDGTASNRSSPVSVVGGFCDWCQVSVGTAHVAAIRTNCTLWTWGCNASGQLGSGTITSRVSPGSIVGGFTDWCRVSAGGTHTAAIRTNGTLWSWGLNSSGQLGNGTITAVSSPVSNVSGFTDWCQVNAGFAHTAAIRTNGTLWSWGLNSSGQLGDNTTINRSSPVSVVGGFTDWCDISAGCIHSAGIRTNTV